MGRERVRAAPAAPVGTGRFGSRVIKQRLPRQSGQFRRASRSTTRSRSPRHGRHRRGSPVPTGHLAGSQQPGEQQLPDLAQRLLGLRQHPAAGHRRGQHRLLQQPAPRQQSLGIQLHRRLDAFLAGDTTTSTLNIRGAPPGPIATSITVTTPACPYPAQPAPLPQEQSVIFPPPRPQAGKGFGFTDIAPDSTQDFWPFTAEDHSPERAGCGLAIVEKGAVKADVFINRVGTVSAAAWGVRYRPISGASALLRPRNRLHEPVP